MNPSDTTTQSGDFEILRNKRLWRPAVALGLLALTLLWLCVLQQQDSSPNKWIVPIPGPYRFELAYDDTLAAIKPITTGGEDLLSVNVKLDSAAVFALMKSPWRGPAEIIVDDFPERIFSGSLGIYEQIVATGKNKKDTRVHAVIEVVNQEKLLKSGMKVRKMVLLDTLTQALVLPDSAIFEMNGEAVVFPRSDWPQPRFVQVGPSSGISIMIAVGVREGEEVALFPPKNLMNVQNLSLDTYGKLLSESRQKAAQFFIEGLNRDALSDSFAVVSEGESANNKTVQAKTALADCTAMIDQMLSEDSSRGISSGRARIGPGEGGKLAPVSPEMLKEMKQGEKISVSVPAQKDTSADTLHTRDFQIEHDSSKTSKEPPEEH